MRPLPIYLVGLGLLVLVCLAQIPQIGDSPKSALSSKQYKALKEGPDFGVMLERRLSVIEGQHTVMMGKQQATHDEVKLLKEDLTNALAVRQKVADNTAQVATNTANIANLEASVRLHVAGQINDPASIAVLQTKVEAISKTLVWLLSGIGGIFIGGGVWMWKQLRSNNRIFTALKLDAEERLGRHTQVLEKIGAVEKETHTAIITIGTIEKQTDGLKDALVQRTAEAEYAKGVKEGETSMVVEMMKNVKKVSEEVKKES